jgi:hypothetical protein
MTALYSSVTDAVSLINQTDNWASLYSSVTDAVSLLNQTDKWGSLYSSVTGDNKFWLYTKIYVNTRAYI